MHLFYNENLESDILELSREESRHCVKVLRLKAGDAVAFTDGKGTFCKASLTEAHPNTCIASVTEREQKRQDRPFHLHLAVAPTKNIDRMEWLLEKATECGFDEFTPLICSQSERKTIKPDRLQRIMISAMKQSQRHFLPTLNPSIRFFDFLKKEPIGNKFIAHCEQGEKKHLNKLYQAGEDVVMLIGPEGDFDSEEIQAALDSGFKPVSLGEYRLRTETAALTSCIHFNIMNKIL